MSEGKDGGAAYRSGIEAQFDALVKKSLRNELNDFFRTNGNRLNSEAMSVNAAAMADAEADAFAAVDSAFRVLGYDFIVKNELLYDALAELEKQQRDVVLLKSSLHRASDYQVGQLLGLETRTVSNIKNRTYKQIKRKMGGDDGDGYDGGNGQDGGNG